MLIGMKTKRIVSSELFEYVSVWMGAVESGWLGHQHQQAEGELGRHQGQAQHRDGPDGGGAPHWLLRRTTW